MTERINLEQILTVIPVLDEEATIATVVRELQAQGLKHIRIVDNDSRDRSAAVARAAGAEVVTEARRSYGWACWRGLQAIPAGIEWILFCDGDGSSDLEDLSPFWEAASRADLVLGDRRATVASRQNLTLPQQFGNWLATTLIWLGWGHRYRDLGPLRLVRWQALQKLQLRDRGFGWTVEMQVRALEEGLRVREIPVAYRDRQGGQSKISGTLAGMFKAGSGILGTIGKLFIGRQPLTVLSAFLVLLGCWALRAYGDIHGGTSLWPLFVLGVGLLGAGFLLSGAIAQIATGWFWGTTLLARLILLAVPPGNDIWRYVWEGRLQNLGFSPYAQPPNATELIPFRTEWWPLINHPDVSAIYPPVVQLGFRAIAAISPTVLAFKLGFVIADLVACYLLARHLGRAKALFYAWNPLILYSFAVGGHYDSWFVLPMVAAWVLWERQRWHWSAFFLGISIGVKWVSLPLCAFIVWRSPWRRALTLIAVGAIPLLVTTPAFCSFSSCPLIPTDSDFVSQGRSAEFIPYLLEIVWPASTEPGFNWIYVGGFGAIALLLLFFSKRLVAFSEHFFAGLLVFSPIIHAWYFSWLVPFSTVSHNLGTRLVSISAFAYFVLPHREALDIQGWDLSDPERFWLWAPFVVGYGWTLWRQWMGTGTSRKERSIREAA